MNDIRSQTGDITQQNIQYAVCQVVVLGLQLVTQIIEVLIVELLAMFLNRSEERVTKLSVDQINLKWPTLTIPVPGDTARQYGFQVQRAENVVRTRFHRTEF